MSLEDEGSERTASGARKGAGCDGSDGRRGEGPAGGDSGGSDSGPSWRPSLQQATEEAAEEGKLVFLDLFDPG